MARHVYQGRVTHRLPRGDRRLVQRRRRRQRDRRHHHDDDVAERRFAADRPARLSSPRSPPSWSSPPFGALAQHRHQPILADDEPGHPLRVAPDLDRRRSSWPRRSRPTSSPMPSAMARETAPWLGLALWAAILVTSLFARPDWSVTRHGGEGRPVPRRAGRRRLADAAQGPARAVMADRVRPRPPLVGLRQHPADGAGASAGRLRLGPARLSRSASAGRWSGSARRPGSR